MIWRKQIMFILAVLATVGAIATLAAFSRRMFKKGTGKVSFTLSSSSFERDASIPPFYTCDGRDVSPALVWQNAPAGTQSFVIVMHDEDALGGAWMHWIVYDIPPAVTKFDEHAVVESLGAKLGINSSGKMAYEGPCPPLKEHRYIFTIYALNIPRLEVKQGADYTMVTKAMENHILDQALLKGTYQRIKSL